MVSQLSGPKRITVMDDIRENSFSRARCGHGDMLAMKSAQRGLEDLRFPWIHNKKLDSFQLLNTALWVNHSAVPS